MERQVSKHSQEWEALARTDPLWAILSAPDKRFNRWTLAEFLAEGEKEISSLMAEAERLSLPAHKEIAIDFGCGVGRLTSALRSHFALCYGVDISPGMLEQARKIAPLCEFREGDSLSSFADDTADLIYSSLVLQHQPDPRSAIALIADMVRVLRPGGLLVFQIPSHIRLLKRIHLRRRLYRIARALSVSHDFLYSRLHLSPIRMQSLSGDTVTRTVTASCGRVLFSKAQADKHCTNAIYYCTK